MSILIGKNKVLGHTYQGGGKGGGGGGSPPPAQQTVTQTSIPEYAAPYVQTMLGKTEALTDINQNPYQSYGGQRIAPFNQNQQTAFDNAINQQTSSQLGTGTAMAGLAGIGSLGAGADYRSMATNPNASAAYMSPYMQNVVETQKNEAYRDAQIRNLGSNLGSAKQGTYGGARQLLGEQERNRNLQQQMANIQATGTQNAFQNAQQAQQFGTTAGLQGYGQALQGASTLGQLGQTQFGQQQAINQGIQNVGNIQQAQAQQGLDLGYQDFLKQRNYPYQQLAFMSDMTRGIPLSQSAQQVYTAPPSAISQLGGLGMSALGIYGMSGGFKPGAKEGGLMSAKAYKEGGLTYAGGGEVSSMSTQQLTEMLNNPSTDQFLAAEIEKELMMRRRMAMNPETDQIMAPALGRSGIASIGTGDMVPEEMAGGGIVAFADRGVVNLKKQSPADALDEHIRNMEEREAASYKNLYENANVFEKSKAAEENIKKEIADSKDKAFYEALAYAGLGTMEGNPDPTLRQNPLSNFAYGAQKGLGAYGKSTERQNQLNKLLLTQGVEQEKAKYGRDVSNHNALQTSLGQAYNRKLLSSQINSGAEDKALLKVQALINQDDQLPLLYKQRDLYEPSDPKYKAYNDAINSIKRSYFEQSGIKRPFVAPANVQFPEEKKEPGFFSRIFGGDSETPKNKVVPFSQLPAKG